MVYRTANDLPKAMYSSIDHVEPARKLLQHSTTTKESRRLNSIIHVGWNWNLQMHSKPLLYSCASSCKIMSWYTRCIRYLAESSTYRNAVRGYRDLEETDMEYVIFEYV